MARRRDEEGAIQVVEAILAALLIVSALVFLTLVQRPAAPATQQGIDLSQVAADALEVLQGANPGSNSDEVQNIVGDLAIDCSPPSAQMNSTRDRVEGALPDDIRYRLIVRNVDGSVACQVDQTRWPPVSAFDEPRNAQAAMAFVAPAGIMTAVELVVWLGY